VHYGYAPDLETYARLLWEADLVVSTAQHEFFGISILEAIYCGCYPLLPRRLSYPELLPEHLHHDHLYHDFDELLERLAWAATHPAAVRGVKLDHLAAPFAWEQLAPLYDGLLNDLVAAAKR
jgi:glycosyltransferase involved in cell wall biosynthesis